MKHKFLIAASLIFFLIINTSYFWEAEVGFLAVPIVMLLIGIYFVLVGIAAFQLYLSFKERFANRSRLAAVILMTIVLTLTVVAPNGIINFEKWEGEDLLVAQRDGTSDCGIVFKLKQNDKFKERIVCFGVREIKGAYKLTGDTLFFSNVELGKDDREYYQFAIIRRSENNNYKLGDLIRYKNKSDTTGQVLWIVKNNLVNGVDNKGGTH